MKPAPPPVAAPAAFRAAALAVAAALAACTPAPAVRPVPGGVIGTLEIGAYTCELGGDALGPAGRRMPAAEFEIVNSSSYVADGIKGTYLLTGDRVEMTSGARRGNRYRRLSRGFLRLTDAEGRDGDLRCVLRGVNGG